MALGAIAVLAFFATPAAAATPAGAPADQGTRQAVVELLDRLPLLFVSEQVSPDGATVFAVRDNDATVWLSQSGLSYQLHPATEVEAQAGAGSWVVALDLVGATPRQPVGKDLLPTRVSYFTGPKNEWRAGLPSYSSVIYRDLWSGVDLVVSGTAGQLKSSFVVRPGADPALIRLAYRGATAVRLRAGRRFGRGNAAGSIREEAPVAYQEVDGQRVEVAAAFELEPGAEPGGRQGYRFRLGAHDPERELVVDPVTLVYCGYIGGCMQDMGYGIAVDIAGNAYVTGNTYSTEATFPVTVGPDLTFNG